MEECQQNHIKSNLHELVKLTTCNSLLIAYLESRKILSESDATNLNSIGNRLKKSLTFYRLVTQRENSYSVLCEALKETNQSGALSILEKLNPIRFDVRQPVHLFTGRDEELAKLHKHLNSGESVATLVTHTASVTGLGGIGKTELCRKYIQTYSASYNGNVIWIGAQKPEMMENSFKILAKDHLSISLKDADGGEKDIKTVVDEVYNYFHEKKCLFVFDNAVNSNDELLSTFLPVRVSKRPHLLITSRDRDWELPMNVLELEELKEHEAIEFVKKGLSIQDKVQDESIVALVTKLQRFPLALQQAISFIKQQKSFKTFAIDEYLTLFEAESKLLLSHQISSFLSNKYAQTTFTTWKITTDVIAADKECGNLALCYLNMISYLEPEEIPTDLLNKYDSISEDEMHFALQLLVKYSMLSCQPTESMFNIHRLVQEVTRIELRNFDKEEETLRKCLLLFGTNSVDKKSVSHAMSAFDFALNYKPLIVDFRSLPSEIMIHLDKTSRYKEALKFGKKSIGVLRTNLPPDDLDLACSETIIGIGQLRLKNHDEVISHLGQVEKIFEKQNPSSVEHHEILKLCLKAGKQKLEEEEQNPNFSSSQHHQRKKEMEENLKIMKSLNFEQIKNIPWPTREVLLHTLSTNFIDTRNFKEAILCNQMVLEYKKKMLGENDVTEVPALMMKIAQLQFYTGDKDASRSTAKTAYEKSKHLFDSDVQTLGIAFRYAKVLEDHDINEALRISKKVYENRKIRLGEEHVDTLETLLLVGNLTTKVGRFEEAVELLQNCCKLYAEHFGESNDFTLNAKTNLAITLYQSESYAEALNIFEDVLKIYTETKGPQNRTTLGIWSYIGIIKMLTEDYKGSLEINLMVEKAIVETCGNDDPRLVEIRNTITHLKTSIDKAAASQAGRRKNKCCCIL